MANVVLVGLALGFRPSASPEMLVVAVALVVAFSHIFTWTYSVLAPYVHDPEAIQSAS